MESIALHSTLEATGAMIALFMAAALLQIRSGDKWRVFPSAAGFIAMGLLDAFHAAAMPGQGFVLLHSMAVLMGGLLFSLVWLPARVFDHAATWRRWMPPVVAAVAVFILVARGVFPAMLRDGRFTTAALAMNVLGGLLFIAYAVRLSISLRAGDIEGYLLFGTAALFGAAGVVFRYSSVWEPTWWFWHVLRLGAYTMAFLYIYREYLGLVASLSVANHRQQRALAELERSNAELEQFANAASHDLQEPLRMVTSNVQLLATRYEGRLDEDADDFVKYALDGAARMRAIIDDLLAYSRAGARGQVLKWTDAQVILDKALANLQVAIEESGATITSSAMPFIAVDASQILQVFQNLIGNAIKFHGSKPPDIRVDAVLGDDTWTFSVADNGLGISPQHFDRIFMMFQRLHGRTEYPGSGIGLAISRKIVEGHGGRMWLESRPGEGSTFFFSLPTEGAEPIEYQSRQDS